MTSMGRKSENFDDISLTAWSRGLLIRVSSSSFQKSSSGWPQQPLTEKVLKFSLIFHDSITKIFLFKYQNKAEFKNLPFVESKIHFLLILAPFLSEAVEASRCYCFENWLMTHKCQNLLKPLGTIIQTKIILLPLRAI